jgi:hypothetical protein
VTQQTAAGASMATRRGQELSMARRLFFVLIALKKWPIPARVRRHLNALILYYTVDALWRYRLPPLTVLHILGLRSLPPKWPPGFQVSSYESESK